MTAPQSDYPPDVPIPYRFLQDVESAIVPMVADMHHEQADNLLLEALRLCYDAYSYPAHIFMLTTDDYEQRRKLGHYQADAYVLRELITMAQHGWSLSPGIKRILVRWYSTVYPDAVDDGAVMFKRLIELSTGNMHVWPSRFLWIPSPTVLHAETEAAIYLLLGLDALAKSGRWEREQSQAATYRLDKICSMVPRHLMPQLYQLTWIRRYWLDALPLGEEAAAWLKCLMDGKLPGEAYAALVPALLAAPTPQPVTFPGTAHALLSLLPRHDREKRC